MRWREGLAEKTRICLIGQMFDYKPYLKSLAEYMAENGYTRKPFPKVILCDKKQDGVFIRTGHYDYEDKKIVLMVNGRHPKDVLRTFAHEMIHHKQNLDGRLSHDTVKGYRILEDNELEKLEAEAYVKGNLIFRKWTEKETGEE